MNARAQERVSATWPSGVCRYCRVGDDQVDGDRLRWSNARRNVCSKPGCIRAFAIEVDDWSARQPKRPRRLSPGEVHARIVEQQRAKRKRYREAAKARAAAERGKVA